MKETQFSFRIRCDVPARSGLSTDQASVVISPEGAEPEVRLVSTSPDLSLAESAKFIVRADGYYSEEDAWTAAWLYRDALIRAFARFRVAVDFGERAPQGGLTEAGMRMLEEGTGQRVLNDVHGIMVFASEPAPVFSRVGGAGIRTPVEPDRVVRAVADAVETDEKVPDRERLAYDLFSASFFASTADARFLNLMMAVETLIDQEERPEVVRQHVDDLLERTQTASALPEEERESLIGGLRWLRIQSVRQAGRQLAETLQGRQYKGMQPGDFFVVCYDIRSKLVHGVYPRPSRGEVGSAAANLELFVADLLAGPLRVIDY